MTRRNIRLGGRLHLGTPAGFKSERVAGFKLECMAGFIGIRTLSEASPWSVLATETRVFFSTQIQNI